MRCDSNRQAGATSSAQRGPKPASSAGRKKAACCDVPTEAMVSAGVAVLLASGAVEAQLSSDKLLVAEIYQAMRAAAT